MKIWTRTALLSLGFFVFPAVAGATYSIVAADTSTMWVGGAGTSCVGSLSVSVLLGAAPGKGAVHAQAALNTKGRDEAQRRLAAGESPEEALAAITSASFDPMAARRQYGAVDLMGRTAAYTGTQNSSFADDIQGDVDGFIYSIQGNILTSEKVLTQAREDRKSVV